MSTKVSPGRARLQPADQDLCAMPVISRMAEKDLWAGAGWGHGAVSVTGGRSLCLACRTRHRRSTALFLFLALRAEPAAVHCLQGEDARRKLANVVFHVGSIDRGGAAVAIGKIAPLQSIARAAVQSKKCAAFESPLGRLLQCFNGAA